uniref:Retrovirus-related Pol polyprotein from transposon TNT 1-94 n=1 Tax=Tanacetum cinerariifolium TaxID=118510 RepID=A0A6L2L607_TANCI|nr:hypothetical protein [Tanacetum cinerariifolium]
MVPPNNLGPDLAGKPVNETSYRGMIRYLKGTPILDLYYLKILGFDLKGYSDSDYAGCNMDIKSTSGACQILSGKLVCWSAKKQQSMATSSAKAKYVAAVGCCASILWMKSQLNHPAPEVVKKELGKIAINLSYLDKTPVLKNSFPLLAYILITGTEVDIREIIYSDLVTKLLNESKLKYVSYPRFISCALQVLLGPGYTQDKKFRFLPLILSNSNFTKDPSKVTEIELTAHMIVVNNRRDSMSLPPLVANPNKGKFQTITSTSPKSQGPEASGELSKKSKRPKSKKPPTKTLVTSPKLMEGSEQSHSVSSGTIPDLQDLKRDIELASTGLPSTIDEGTRKSNPLLEGVTWGQRPRGNKPPADMEPQNPTDADLSGTGAKKTFWELVKKWMTILSLMKPNISRLLLRKTNSLHPLLHTLKHSTLILQEKNKEEVVHYVNLKASIDDYYNENIAHKDQIDNLVEASMSSLKKSNSTINDLYKGLEVITQLLKEITNSVKDDPATNKKIKEASETLGKISTHTTKILSSVRSFDFSALQATVKNIQDHAFKQEEALGAWMKSSINMAWNITFLSSVTSTFSLTDTSTNVEGENATYTATKEPISHTKGEIDANIQDNPEEPKQSTDANIFIGSSTYLPAITQAQPITIIHPEPYVLQREVKGIATDDQEEGQRKLVKSSSIVYIDPGEPDKEEEIKKVEEEARLNAISKPEVIKVVREEAKKLGIHPKEGITTKAGELLKKA